MIYEKYLKRIFDFFISSISIIIFFIPMIGFAFLIKISSKGPVFFLQKRLGYKGTSFQIYKFRTMTEKKRTHHKEIFGYNDEVTLVRYWMRRFKIDELPQLINILKGEMSIVGPRPALIDQKEKLNHTTIKRLNVKPGLTGLSQVSGNIYLEWEDRWKYDIQYVNNISFIGDIKIILKTIYIIIFGENQLLKK